jgi:peptide/nickel transport system permease protein/oligopeptide transport system permease protein
MSDIDAITTAESPAPSETAPAPSAETSPVAGAAARPRSLFQDALRDLRRNPITWIAGALIVVVVLMAVAPSLFSSANPNECSLSRQYQGPSGGAFFGFDFQGCDIYARTVYGAKASVQVGIFAIALTAALGVTIGMSAGYFGGITDALLSRLIDVVLAMPYLLAALVLARRLTAGTSDPGIWPVVLVLGLLGWTTAARVIRSSVLGAKQLDYVAAARMLGANDLRILWRHILPNAAAPTVVVLTITMGGFIAAEATLSFLGVGLRDPTVSWGQEISKAVGHVREAAVPLLAPSAFLGVTVLAFIMLGDAVRDAFDPKLR